MVHELLLLDGHLMQRVRTLDHVLLALLGHQLRLLDQIHLHPLLQMLHLCSQFTRFREPLYFRRGLKSESRIKTPVVQNESFANIYHQYK